MTVETQFHTLSDGRTLAYCEYGAPDGHPVFYAHGGPGSRLEGAIYHDKAAEYGFRLIATDRPGMGRSTFKPGRTLLDYPADIAQLADALGIERFGVVGHSGGGAHTTVCAYALPDRLTFTMPIAGYTNFAELPDAASLLRAKVDQIAVGLSQSRPRIFRLFFELMAFSAKYLPNMYMREVTQSVNDTDRRILQDPAFVAHMIADQQEAMRSGGKGVTLDAAVHYVDWGFRLAEIPGKVIILHGTEDYMVPVEYAEHLAANIPNADLHLLEGQGHLFPWDHQDRVFQLMRAEVENA